MMLRACAVFLCLSFGLLSCNFSKFEGYAVTDTGLHYKLLTLGDGDSSATTNDFLRFDMELRSLDDSVLFDSEKGYLSIPDLKYNHTVDGGLMEALGMLYEGDSASFIIQTRLLELENHRFLPAVPAELEYVKCELKLYDIITPDELNQKLKEISWKLDAEMNEQVILKEFLAFNNIDEEYFKDGIYVLPIKNGNGNRPRKGDVLRIHYTAYFVDSTQLDNTYFLNRPLEIEWGAPGQMLKGFEMGMRHLTEGSKAIFIIPSLFAFGERGSSNGSVPPYTTIIYEVHFIEIVKNPSA